MGLILALPRRLQKFQYVVGYHLEDFCPHAFYASLCTHADSLEELVIKDTDEREEERRSPAILGSLLGFIALKHLTLAVDLLFRPVESKDGVAPPKASRNPLDVLLPPSLITLKIPLESAFTVTEFSNAAGLPESLDRTSVHLPNLRVFQIEYDSYGDGGKDLVDRLKRSSAGHQIELRLDEAERSW